MVVVTDKELEVLQLLAKGCSNEEIGKELFKSKRTIDKRITELNFRFDVKNRTALVAKLLAMGVIENPFASMKNQ